jgi:hypothetical protein
MQIITELYRVMVDVRDAKASCYGHQRMKTLLLVGQKEGLEKR